MTRMPSLVKRAFLAAIAACAGVAMPAVAEACSCIMGAPPCQAFWEAEAVFVGRVTAIADLPRKPAPSLLESRAVTFDVLEPFRGRLGASVTITTGFGGGDCGYPFKSGERYIVYAMRLPRATQLSTGICNRTRPVRQGEEDLGYARGVATSTQSLVQIQGRATHREWDPATTRPTLEERPAQDVTLVLKHDGEETMVTSDEAGLFRQGVEPGAYTIDVRPPPLFHASWFPREVTIPDARGCVSVDVMVRYDGHIRGQILDAQSKPVAGVTVNAAAPSRDEAWGGSDSQAVTDEAGWFEIEKLAPGTYVVGLNLSRTLDGAMTPRPRVYHPGTTSASSRANVEVGPGEHVDLGPFRLPPTVTFAGFSGQVLDENRTPAAGAHVHLFEDAERRRLVSSAPTDDRGAFKLVGVAGVRYWIASERQTLDRDEEGYPRYSVEKSQSVEAVAGEHPDEIVLILSRTRP